jgi:protein SCO1
MLVSFAAARSCARRLLRWRVVVLASALLLVSYIVGAHAFAASEGSQPPALLTVIHGRDQRGEPFSIERLAGKAILLNLVFTRCGSVCPTQTRELARLEQALPDRLRSQVALLSLSIDPSHDSPTELARFARTNGADWPNWTFVTAAPTETDALVAQLQGGAGAEALPQGHGTALYLFDRFGRLLQRYVGAPLDQRRLLADVERMVRISHSPPSPPPPAHPEPVR